MPFTFTYDVGIVDVFALTFSLFALVATLRKKEYGKFAFIELKDNPKELIWIQLIKTDIHEVNFSFEPYTNMSGVISLLLPDAKEDTFWDFFNETQPYANFNTLKGSTIIKLKGCRSSKVNITYRDKYNNLYSQTLTEEKISKRVHKNFWNLTFIGS